MDVLSQLGPVDVSIVNKRGGGSMILPCASILSGAKVPQPSVRVHAIPMHESKDGSEDRSKVEILDQCRFYFYHESSN